MENESLESIMANLSSSESIESNTSDTLVPENDLSHIKDEDVKQEVKDMIENVSFFDANIDKDMSVLEKEYVKMERDAADIDEQIAAYKEANKAIFDGLAELEAEKAKALEHKEDYREVICSKMNRLGEKKWTGLEVSFTYVAATSKSKFDAKKFELEQPVLYKKYTVQTPVKAYIKTTLNLLPKELRKQADSLGK